MPRRLFLAPTLCLALLLIATSGCGGSNQTTDTTTSDGLVVSGLVILPDSSGVANAFVRTEPPSENLATDEQGRFTMTRLPSPGEYTFVATHPDAQYEDLEGRTTAVVAFGQAGLVYIIIGKTQRMDLLETGQQALPTRSQGKKRTGTR